MVRSLKITTWLFNLIIFYQRNLFANTSFTLLLDLWHKTIYYEDANNEGHVHHVSNLHSGVKITVLVLNSFTSTKHTRTSSLKLYVVPSYIIRCKLSACRVTVRPQLGYLSALDSSVWFPLFYRHSLFFLRKSFSKFYIIFLQGIFRNECGQNSTKKTSVYFYTYWLNQISLS